MDDTTSPPAPVADSVVEMFATLADVATRFKGCVADFVRDALVCGFSRTKGFVFVDEKAEFEGALSLPTDMTFIAKVECVGPQVWTYDQDGYPFAELELVRAIVETLPDAPEGKIFNLASICTGANISRTVVFTESPKAHKPRNVELTRTSKPDLAGPITLSIQPHFQDEAA